jgi:hypothetical protein
MRDAVTPLCRMSCHIILMARQPAPISLRLRSAEVTSRARKVLRRLDEENLLRRVKWQALKALASVYKMDTVAAPS